MGTNGYLIYDGERCEVYSPRENFDEKGMFICQILYFRRDSLFNNVARIFEKSISFYRYCFEKFIFFSEKFDLDVNIMKYFCN